MYDFLYPYFKITDFDSPDQKGSGDQMSLTVLKSLVKARHWIQLNWNNRGKKKIVFIVTSAYRSESHNAKVGGVNDSSHRNGTAVDIAFNSVSDACVIIIALALSGFFRIGINFSRNFIHADMDHRKSPSVWFYSTGLLRLLGIGKNKEEDA